MKRIIIAAIISLCTILSAGAAFAEEETQSTAAASYNEASGILKAYIDQTPNIKSPESFKSIVACSPEAMYDNISAYISFIYKNRFTSSELEVINRILENGTTIQSLSQVYKFWLTTDEDFQMIEQICALEDSYFSEYWFESAFNKLTNHVHGELDGSKIIEYMEEGLTTDQILAANVMCRKEGQNIVAILDSHLAGNSIENQAMVLYGVDSIPQTGSLFEIVTSLAENSKATPASSLFSIRNASESVVAELIKGKIDSELSRLGVLESAADPVSDYNALRNTGYPLNVQRTLLNKGYTPEEIAKSKEFISERIGKSIKLAREMLRNEK